MKVVWSYFKLRAGWILACILCMFAAGSVIHLNDVPMSEWIYVVWLCLFFMLVFGGYDLFKYCRKHLRLVKLREIIRVNMEAMDLPEDILDEDYQELLRIVYQEGIGEINQLKNRNSDMTEYYMMWVHQIKTPIAAMRLLLQREDTSWSREVAEELFRVEQYVEMTLHYLRLNAETNDFVFRKVDLDEVVREAVHKYAKIFVRKKIGLVYEPLNVQVVSDEKWLEFVIEQLLSNAVKYTSDGSVSIYMKEGRGKTLVIEDTGIGIRMEDLPRVCEKGFTGYNGHSDKRSTGIGLYLCKRMLGRLSHTIEIESEVGSGTRVLVGLETWSEEE